MHDCDGWLRHDVTVIDPKQLWDFDDPAGSERRFRDAAGAAEGEERAILLTQVARALGLQSYYDEAHRLLDELDASGPNAAARAALERGRLHRSSGQPDAAAPYFVEAARLAEDADLDELRVDAMHMTALVVEPDRARSVNEAALKVARASTDPGARDWDASLLTNIGMTHADAGDHAAALVSFEEALEARQRIGGVPEIRVARWMVAWSLRNLGRRDEALAMQLALKAELDADGEVDAYVDEEIALLQPGT